MGKTPKYIYVYRSYFIFLINRAVPGLEVRPQVLSLQSAIMQGENPVLLIISGVMCFLHLHFTLLGEQRSALKRVSSSATERISCRSTASIGGTTTLRFVSPLITKWASYSYKQCDV